jgi:hypothetical protein
MVWDTHRRYDFFGFHVVAAPHQMVRPFMCRSRSSLSSWHLLLLHPFLVTSHVRSFCGIYFPCFFLWFVLSLAYPFYVPPLIRLASGKHSSGCRVWAGCASGLPQQPVQSRSLLAAGHGKRIAQQWMHSRCFFRLLATKLCGVASGLGQQWVGAEWAWKILKAGCNGSRIGTGYTRNIF